MKRKVRTILCKHGLEVIGGMPSCSNCKFQLKRIEIDLKRMKTNVEDFENFKI